MRATRALGGALAAAAAPSRAVFWKVLVLRSFDAAARDPAMPPLGAWVAAKLAAGEWHQTIVIGNDTSLVAGRYYITLTGGVSVNGSTVELAAALICRAGFYRPQVTMRRVGSSAPISPNS